MILTLALLAVVVIFTVILIALAKSSHVAPKKQPILHPFSADIKFDPFPDAIEINNPHVCTPDQPRLCDINNLTSCIGCQSLLARCTHISQDIEYFDTNNNKFILLANQSDQEGYCLTVNETNLNAKCNVFHGDLALIQLKPNLPETMFFCNCTNPGLIGNTTILGACDTAFVCNGRVKNIDVPFDEIECVCESTHRSTILNNIPVCARKTVGEASADGTLNDMNLALQPHLLLPNTIENFPRVIVDTVHSDNLINPCSLCPITNAFVANNAMGTVTDAEGVVSKYCTVAYTRFSDANEIYGIPYRRSPNERLLSGADGPDCILGIWWYEVVIYTNLGFKQRMVFKFEYSAANHDLFVQMNLDKNTKYVVSTDDVLLGVHLRVPPMSTLSQPGVSCTAQWPTYWCEWNQERRTQFNRNWTTFSNVQPADGNSNIVPHVGQQTLPGGFLWGRDPWHQMQRLNVYLTGSQNNEYISHSAQFTQNQNTFAPDIQMIAYGFRRINTSSIGIWRTIMLNNGNYDDWERVQNRLTDIN